MNDAKVIWCKCGNRVYVGQDCPICPLLEATDKIDERKAKNDTTDNT